MTHNCFITRFAKNNLYLSFALFKQLNFYIPDGRKNKSKLAFNRTGKKTWRCLEEVI